MLLGREVRFKAILLSCIAVLGNGTIAIGTEGACGLPARTIGSSGSACSSDTPFGISRGEVLSFPDYVYSLTHCYVTDEETLAMALPDGPGAIWFGIVGYVFVSFVKNRRVWIGLCVLTLSGGRAGATRLSRVGIPGGMPAGSDLLSESEPGDALLGTPVYGEPQAFGVWYATGLFIPCAISSALKIHPQSLGWHRDDRGIVNRRRQAARSDEIEITSAAFAGWGIAGRSAFSGCIGWARPPPVRGLNSSG